MTLPNVAETPQSFDEDAWDDLLNYIEEHRVVPIIGPDLLRVQTDAGLRPLYVWLAEKLAARLSVDPVGLPQPLTLNDVMCSYLGQHGRREEAYTRLRSIMREVHFEPPQALRQLARITDFELFVTTTFDPLLGEAVNAERYGGQPGAEVIAYTPNRVADLPSELADLKRTVVYHLLGRLSASPTYVLSDEDMLEFICALQSEHLAPEKLFHELEHNHLLLIGSDFSNWLARLFLRMAKRKRLSDPRDVTEVFADDHTAKDARLVAFLETAEIRDNTVIIVMSDNGASQEGGPLGFVNAMGPYNFRPEPLPAKLQRIDDIGGPDTHSNFPHGWAMASNTPLRRYKQNTHGGGIRDPFVMSWPKRIKAKGELRHQFVHACDLTPTLLDLIGVAAPAEIAG